MKDRLLKIINHYGIDNQQRKLEEEVFELQQAITGYEIYKSNEYEIPLNILIGNKKHMEEEIGDVENLLEEIILYYDLDRDNIYHNRTKKVDRQINRMESEKND